MPILTVELTEEAYQNALALPVAERERMIVNTFTARNMVAEGQKVESGLSLEDLASIGRGFEDMDAGRVHDGDTVLAELRAMVGR